MKKILVIDDDVDMIDLLESRLRRNNYEVVFANDGDSGYKKAIEQKPDLIIMDIMMPTMSGGDSVKLLKANETTRGIPIVFFTSINSYLPQDTSLDQVHVDGLVYPALTKPFNPAKFLAMVRSVIGE